MGIVTLGSTLLHCGMLGRTCVVAISVGTCGVGVVVTITIGVMMVMMMMAGDGNTLFSNW